LLHVAAGTRFFILRDWFSMQDSIETSRASCNQSFRQFCEVKKHKKMYTGDMSFIYKICGML
jgi:hypothetical protein